MYTAQVKALEKLAAKDAENSNKIYPWLLTSLKAKQNPITLKPKESESYVGKFGSKNITYENGDLFYQLNTVQKVKMVPLEKDLFDLEDTMLRVEFKKVNGKIASITVHNVNGNAKNYQKN